MLVLGKREKEPMTDEQKTLNGKVELIRWRMAHEKLRFADEFRIIPSWIKVLAIAVFFAGQVVAHLVYFFVRGLGPWIAIVGIAAAVTLIIDFFLLLFGYVNRDAKRREMNSTMWTLIVIFVPYLIGLVIYFFVRDPLPFVCPGCHASVSARFNFCPNCKHDLRPSCPQCKHEVTAEDKYCPFCAYDLRGKTIEDR